MERFCGSIQPGIRSRRFPWASIDRHVLENAQLTQIKVVYDVGDVLDLRDPPANIPGSLSDPLYPTCVLLPPKSQTVPSSGELRSIAAALSTRLDATMTQVNRALKGATVEDWGKVRRIDSDEGDTMRSCSLGANAEDTRDATYVRYEMLVDKFANRKKTKPVYQLKTFYGQLEHIYRVHFPDACPAMGTDGPTTFILAAVRTCDMEPEDRRLQGIDIHFYSGSGALDVIDITSVQVLVGRVEDTSGAWAIVDRSGGLARALWAGDDLE